MNRETLDRIAGLAALGPQLRLLAKNLEDGTSLPNTDDEDSSTVNNTTMTTTARPGDAVSYIDASGPRRFGDPRFYKLLDEIATLHSDKNHDYSPSNDPLHNFRRTNRIGVEPYIGILCRMVDKWSRIEELSKCGKIAKNESLRDSLIDNAVYSLIAVLLLEEVVD